MKFFLLLSVVMVLDIGMAVLGRDFSNDTRLKGLDHAVV